MSISKLEIACFNLPSAVNAQLGGADRVELCVNQSLGGTTPSVELIIQVRNAINIDLNVMIRNRGGDFCYSNDEFEMMKNDIIHIKKLGVNGFVFGILTKNSEVDIERNKQLVKLAHPLSCTFHKAFDEVEDTKKSLLEIIDCGFHYVLTSGKKAKAIDGVDLLKELISQADNKVIIMPGGGVRSEDVFELKTKTNAEYFHSSALINNQTVADLEEIKKLKKRISNHE